MKSSSSLFAKKEGRFDDDRKLPCRNWSDGNECLCILLANGICVTLYGVVDVVGLAVLAVKVKPATWWRHMDTNAVRSRQPIIISYIVGE